MTIERTSSECECSTGLTEATASASSPVGTHNPPGRTRLRYRVGIHGTFKESMLQAAARTAGLVGHTSRDDASATTGLLDSTALMLDILTFYQEVLLNEAFLLTATERLSLLELSRSIGYELKPGVAAGTQLAFEVQTSPGMDEFVHVPVGVQVQSIPPPDALPQMFETVAAVEAHPAWNRVPVRQTRQQSWVDGKNLITLNGTGLGLVVGALLLIRFGSALGATDWTIAQIADLNDDFDRKVTEVTLAQALTGVSPVAEGYPRIYAFSVNASAFGAAAPDWRSLPAASKREILDLADNEEIPAEHKQEWPNFTIHLPAATSSRFALDDLVLTIQSLPLLIADSNGGPSTDFAMTLALETTPQSTVDISLRTDTLSLDSEYGTILSGSLIYLDDPAGTGLLEVSGVETVSRSDFALSGKSTVITTDADELETYRFEVRTLTVHAGSRELQLGDEVDPAPVSGDTIEVPQTMASVVPTETIDVPMFMAGQTLAIEGRDIASGQTIAELTTVQSVVADEAAGVWRVKLSQALANSFERASSLVYGNLAAATHGTSHAEILGHGDARQRFVQMSLSGVPLTYQSSSASPSGADSTLDITVDGVEWSRSDSFYEQPADAQIYTLRHADDGTVIVQFGDGKTGQRLPTGANNVNASYRTGLGADGNLEPGRLVSLVSRPLGLSAVAQPVAATGGEDPESRDDARINAPLTVTTLDRLVSLQDYADFARAFAGIAKAQSAWGWFGETQGILLTVAGVDGAEIPSGADIERNLVDAIARFRDPGVPVQLTNHVPRSFTVVGKLYYDTRYDADALHAQAIALLIERFGFAAMELSQAVTSSAIVALLHEMPGVRGVDLDALHRSDNPRARKSLIAARTGTIRRNGKVWAAELLTIDETSLALSMVEDQC